jgi:hypothetical protein
LTRQIKDKEVLYQQTINQMKKEHERQRKEDMAQYEASQQGISQQIADLREENRASKEQVERLMLMFKAFKTNKNKEETILFDSDSSNDNNSDSDNSMATAAERNDDTSTPQSDDASTPKREGELSSTPQRKKKSRPTGFTPTKTTRMVTDDDDTQHQEEGHD